MPNFTFEDYKNAIRAKFEIEKKRDPSHLLASASQAKLRIWCWEIFSSNTNPDDLRTFRSFFDFEFDPSRSNNFRDHTDKFRPVGTFLKGETDPINPFLVELAAVLVDFQPRPFSKYREKGVIPIIETIIDDVVITPTKPPIPIILTIGENSNEKNTEKEKENEIKPVIEEVKNGDNANFNNFTGGNVFVSNQRLGFWEPIKQIFNRRLKQKIMKTLLGVVVIFGLIGTVIYFAFFKMHCMQWSGDHYEIVDCKSEIKGNANPIIGLDERLLDFRKVAVCDTTTCFRPDGQAIVWYAKNKDKAEFFNSNGIGRHPETERALRPVTEYIKGKYKIPCDLKQK